jgi:hypothetical protein
MKSFKGMIADDKQQKIYISGGDSDKGYRIKRFEVLFNNPAGLNAEAVLKIYSVKQTSTSALIDFTDDTLLGAAFIENSNSASYFGGQTILFDDMTFNQDIYITYEDNGADHPCNYYLELEEVTMNKGEQAVVNFNAALLHGE